MTQRRHIPTPARSGFFPSMVMDSPEEFLAIVESGSDLLS